MYFHLVMRIFSKKIITFAADLNPWRLSEELA